MVDGGSRLIGHRQPEGGYRAQRHPEPTGVGTDLLGERALRYRGVPPGIRVGGADDVEDGSGVGHRPAEGPLGDHSLPSRKGGGHPTATRLEADQAAARRRYPDRAATVAGVGHGEHAGGHRGAGTPARSPGGVSRVPRISGDPEPLVLGHGDRSELGGVGPAGEDEAGANEGVGDRRAGGAGALWGAPGPVGHRLALHREQILDREGHPGKGGKVRHAAGDPLPERPCLGTGLLVVAPDHRVELGVADIDSGQALVEHLERADLLGPDGSGYVQARCEFVHRARLEPRGGQTKCSGRRTVSTPHPHSRPRRPDARAMGRPMADRRASSLLTMVTRSLALVTAVYSSSRVRMGEPTSGSETMAWENSDPWLLWMVMAHHASARSRRAGGRLRASSPPARSTVMLPARSMTTPTSPLNTWLSGSFPVTITGFPTYQRREGLSPGTASATACSMRSLHS